MAKVVAKLADDISTDIIYPGRYMATVLPSETPQYAFADLAEFNARLKAKQVPPGSVLVAGKNFGCGSSREQAASTLKGHELVIVARNFARIFLQNAINLGLRTVVVSGHRGLGGGRARDRVPDRILNRTTGKSFAVTPLPKARQAIIDAGGLIAYTRKRVMEQGLTGAVGPG